MEDVNKQDIAWYQFTALYLPNTISRYLDPPPAQERWCHQSFIAHYRLFNTYLAMIVQIHENPYFAKYIRSESPRAGDGKRLAQVLADRIVEYAPRADDILLGVASDDGCSVAYYEDILIAVLKVLSTLLVLWVKVDDQRTVVTYATRQRLMPWLAKWSKRGESATMPVLGRISGQVSAQMSALWPIEEVKTLRNRLRGVDVCSLPSCDTKAGTRVCAR